MSQAKQRQHFKAFTDNLLSIEGACAEIGPMRDVLGPKVLTDGVKTIRAVATALERLAVQLDIIEYPEVFFNPTSPSIAGELIAEHLNRQKKIPITALGSAWKGNGMQFYGSGVYALYYSGLFEAYAPIRGTDHPIYIGKSDPAKADAESPRDQGLSLHTRLKEHRGTLDDAYNLDPNDFHCRFLVVGSGWQAAVEQVLIERYLPVWNKETGVLSGFGKHGDNAETRNNTKSGWDTLHPGRDWASKNPDHPREADVIIAGIYKHFQEHPPIPMSSRQPSQ